MNILFLYSETINPIKGGVERITYLLANYLESKGFQTMFLSLKNCNQFEDKRQFSLPDSNIFVTKKNIKFFRDFLIEKSIDIIVNKGGTDPKTSEFAYYCKDLDVKLISNVHNSLLGTINNFRSAQKLKFKKIGLEWLLPLTDKKLIKKLLLKLYKQKYGSHYRSLCKNSDFVILESNKFKQELMFFMSGNTMTNVTAISNFVLFDEIININKKKEILFVGRINTSQKRVDLLLEIWNLLHEKFPDWSLKIVGGGDELDSMKKLGYNLKLKNIFFYGYKEAKPFYETASIICLTSSYEGFGIALIEAMQHGAIPFAFNSYLSVTDIIEDNKNGRLIEPFDINKYACALSKLMSSQKKLDSFSKFAIESSKKFDLSIIGEQWITLFKELNNSSK